jgi:predicted nuclease with RNAse H fold
LAVLGVDLAGVESRPTGLCLLKGLKAETWIAWRDEEVVEAASRSRVDVVAVDAPLGLPKGRKSLEERSPYHLRRCDRELLERGIKFFPVTLGSMRRLTERGMKLKERLEGEGFKVIEVYPGGAQDVLGIPRKKAGREALLEGLRGLGLEGPSGEASSHELDAATAALTAALYLAGLHEELGDPDEGVIVMPRRGLSPREVRAALLSLASDP